MLTNSVVEILNLQNQIKGLEDRLARLIQQDPYNPKVVEARLDLAFIKGQLHVWLEVAEKLSV